VVKAKEVKAKPEPKVKKPTGKIKIIEDGEEIEIPVEEIMAIEREVAPSAAKHHRHKPTKPVESAPGSGVVCKKCGLELTILERPYISKQPGLEGFYHWACFREQVRLHQRDAQSLIEESAISAGVVTPAAEGAESPREAED